MLFPKSKRIRDKKHLSFVRMLPCVECFRKYEGYYATPSKEAHHIRLGANAGMALKSGDNFTIPLCPAHHSLLHKKGEKTFYGEVEGYHKLANELYEHTGDRHKALQLIYKAQL